MVARNENEVAVSKKEKLRRYRDFLDMIEDYQMNDFLEEYYVSTKGDITYTPSYNRFRCIPVIMDLIETHNGFKNIFGRIPDDRAFNLLLSWCIRVYVRKYFSERLHGWVHSRYDIPEYEDAFMMPPYEYEVITPEEISLARSDKTFGGREEHRAEVKYRWVKVSETVEGENIRAHCIFVDKVTLLEAPLLPGVVSWASTQNPM